jgi:hypothetical protein
VQFLDPQALLFVTWELTTNVDSQIVHNIQNPWEQGFLGTII